jgi:hypothetical protein
VEKNSGSRHLPNGRGSMAGVEIPPGDLDGCRPMPRARRRVIAYHPGTN